MTSDIHWPSVLTPSKTCSDPAECKASPTWILGPTRQFVTPRVLSNDMPWLIDTPKAKKRFVSGHPTDSIKTGPTLLFFLQFLRMFFLFTPFWVNFRFTKKNCKKSDLPTLCFQTMLPETSLFFWPKAHIRYCCNNMVKKFYQLNCNLIELYWTGQTMSLLCDMEGRLLVCYVTWCGRQLVCCVTWRGKPSVRLYVTWRGTPYVCYVTWRGRLTDR